MDYATALEAALVPEMDFSKRRMSRRAALLVARDPAEQDAVLSVVKKLYDIRSSVVHGTPLDDKQRTWLFENCGQVEHRLRQVLVAAVQNIPADDAERRTTLAALYDPTDDDRGDFVVQKFQEIPKRSPLRKAVADKIGQLSNV